MKTSDEVKIVKDVSKAVAVIVQNVPAGTFTVWGTAYVGLSGRSVITPSWNSDTGVSTPEMAQRDVDDLRRNLGITGRVVSRTVTIGDWA